MTFSRLDFSLMGVSIVLLILIAYRVLIFGDVRDRDTSIGLADLKSERVATVGTTSYKLVREDLARLLQDRDHVYQANIKKQKQVEPQFWKLSPHPLPETLSNAYFGWTGENLKDGELLNLVANNSKMKSRLERENAWTKKRELVYLKEPFFKEAQLVITGKKSTLDIPGIDGEVYKVIIPEDKLYFSKPGEMMGAFVGHLEGDPNISVNVGMCGKTWSVEIILDDDHMLDITGRPDMGGEWVVTQVDLEKQRATEGDAKCIQYRDPDQLAHQPSNMKTATEDESSTDKK